jgi:hypothetical protein
MDHPAFIFAVALVAFVAFVAAKGTLANYIAVLWGPTSAPLPKPASTSSSSGTSSSSSSNTAEAAQLALSIFGG